MRSSRRCPIRSRDPRECLHCKEALWLYFSPPRVSTLTFSHPLPSHPPRDRKHDDKWSQKRRTNLRSHTNHLYMEQSAHTCPQSSWNAWFTNATSDTHQGGEKVLRILRGEWKPRVAASLQPLSLDASTSRRWQCDRVFLLLNCFSRWI